MKVRPVIQAVMDEHVRLPGCPQLIVTRGWLCAWLRDELGYDPHARGFASIDYLVFGRPVVNEPLTDLADPVVARILAFMVETENPKTEVA